MLYRKAEKKMGRKWAHQKAPIFSKAKKWARSKKKGARWAKPKKTPMRKKIGAIKKLAKPTSQRCYDLKKNSLE